MKSLTDQAAELECLLPMLMRRLFGGQPDDPLVDLPLAQLRVCSILQSGPRSMTSLGEELGISLSAVTQIADRLERAGMVERAAEPDDRRMKYLQFTLHGAELMRRRREVRVRRVAGVLVGLPESDRDEVIAAVRRLVDHSRSAGASEALDLEEAVLA